MLNGDKFFIGTACKKCKNTQRYTSNGGCANCLLNVESEKYLKHNRKYYRNNKEKIQERAKLKRMDLGIGYARSVITRLKSKAKKIGIPFNLTIDDIKIPEFCPVLGIKIAYTEGSGAKDYSPSVDRIFPEKGYVKDNIVIVSKKANCIKNNASLSDLKKVYEFYGKIIPI